MADCLRRRSWKVSGNRRKAAPALLAGGDTTACWVHTSLKNGGGRRRLRSGARTRILTRIPSRPSTHFMPKRKAPKNPDPSTARSGSPTTEPYTHPTADAAGRPEVGTQAHFKKKKAPKTYAYDSSLDPQLVWAGKAERLSFDVPTLPLFVHERLSTEAILETLGRHKKDQQAEFDLFGDPKRSIADQTLRAYEYRDEWVNRMILGDSLVVMNSLLEYEGMGGQVQMIYIDPPYGVKFGSNFQPFVRKRDVKNNDDADMTREPEMVQAYRDTWELGVHSYLTYLRDRLLLAHELLSPSGSVFVQIGAENVHHARELLDETFGTNNFISQITFAKTTGSTGNFLASTTDFLLLYARQRESFKYRRLFGEKTANTEAGGAYSWLEMADGSRRRMSAEERRRIDLIPPGSRIFRFDNLQSQSIGRQKGEGAASWFPVTFDAREFRPTLKTRWKTNQEGMANLLAARRLIATDSGLYYVRYLDDFPAREISDTWNDTVIAGFASDKSYVVETSSKVIQRCILMTTDPGDLVIDPTCGSGTTAYVAEQWGRRWITIDTSRVPLALARQRLLTATYQWYELKDDARGPAGGFSYSGERNNKGEDVGGIIPHVTLKSIANNEPADEEVLVDRPDIDDSITRVTGPFCVEATIPTSMVPDSDGSDSAAAPGTYKSYVDRMLDVLRRSPTIRLEGNRSVTLENIRPPARALTIAVEAMVGNNGAAKPIAVALGPENGAVSERLVYEAAREARAKNYSHLYVIGFAIEPNARQLIDQSSQVADIPATYIQATPDLLMGDLLKNMRSSQIFSVCGLPDVVARRVKKSDKSDPDRYELELRGVDTFDPVSMEVTSLTESDIPAWFLDSDYNGRCFRVSQAFFPKTEAWESLRKALKADFDDSVWDHLRGITSAPFEASPDQQLAVKVIDHRGNELMVVKSLREALQ
jgi:adenine-specific DNA-methyltransferase